ncbi:hypothetical protein NC652_009901 [Populus alba x Populus x berolinensis]|nr:hypothetical protein NC652_009901 [Populus alba x Populus x berolinensis]
MCMPLHSRGYEKLSKSSRPRAQIKGLARSSVLGLDQDQKNLWRNGLWPSSPQARGKAARRLEKPPLPLISPLSNAII